MLEPPIHHEDPAPDAALPPHLHIPGAGTFVMGLLLASLSMLFLASILVYCLIRNQIMSKMAIPQWPPAGLPKPPSSLWLSTFVILASSITIQLALTAIRRDNGKKLRFFLYLTFALGLLFLALQSFNWFEFYQAIPPAFKLEGPYLGMFFTLTGLHAAHVIGGLIPLALVIHHARQGRYSRNFHPGIRYATLYWHFLDVIWLILFSLLYL